MELVTPGLGLLFWTGLIFLILLLLLRRFAFPPITKMLDERERKIEDSLKQAEQTRAKMEHMQSENEALLNRARLEREKILTDAHLAEKAIRAESFSRAKQEYDRMLSDAAAEIEREKLAAIEQLKSEVASLAVSMAEKVISRELADPSKQIQLIEKDLMEVQKPDNDEL